MQGKGKGKGKLGKSAGKGRSLPEAIKDAQLLLRESRSHISDSLRETGKCRSIYHLVIMGDGRFHIVSARTAEHISAARSLFTAYVEWLNIDLTYQDYQSELNTLPGKYSAPHGELLLAYSTDGIPLGCVAARSLDQGETQTCEMKRLYVSPQARGMGLGKALVTAIVQQAKEMGYKEMRLDTLPSKMRDAIQMYTRLGFVETPPYYETPVDETVFLALDLTR